MKRKTSTVPTKIYTFGCRVSKESQQLLREEHLRKAHDYHNTLVGIELERRNAFREARAGLPDLVPLEKVVLVLCEQIEAGREKLNKTRQKDRKRTKMPELESQVKVWRGDLKKAREALREARKAVQNDPVLQAATEAMDEQANLKTKEAYAEAPTIFWGTKLLVAKSVEAAFDASKKTHIDPKAKRWEGRGRVGVQIQERLTTEGLFAGASQFFQLDPLPEDQFETRSGRRSAYTKARLRVGSEGRSPVWVEVDVLLHRPIPPKAVIKWAWIHIKSVGTRSVYSLQIALESESFQTESGDATAAFALGWTAIPEGPHAGGIQVGYLLDGQGYQKQFILPAKVVEQLRFTQAVHSDSDTIFNSAIESLKVWKLVHEAPAWVIEATETMAYWRSHKKLGKVAYRWVRELMSGDRIEALWGAWKTRKAEGEDLFDQYAVIADWVEEQGLVDSEEQIAIYLEWWRRKNLHLYEVESNQREKALLHRREVFRGWALEIRETYGKVLVEDRDFSQRARNAMPEESAADDYTHGIRTEVAPSELRLCLHGLVKFPVEPLACPACEQTNEGCRCGMESDFARCWALLNRAGEDTAGVSKAWEASKRFMQEVRKLAG